MLANTKPIDVVIAWVDGSDPDLNKKRMEYLDPRQKKQFLEQILLDLIP